jgi:hypothetical protein
MASPRGEDIDCLDAEIVGSESRLRHGCFSLSFLCSVLSCVSGSHCDELITLPNDPTKHINRLRNFR